MVDLLLFVPACFALNLAFGPNNLMALSNGARRGVGYAVIAGLGRLLVFVPMISLSALGLGIVLLTSAWVFTVTKTVGAAYLIWLGWRTLRSASVRTPGKSPDHNIPLITAFQKEALVALGNPKAILIFAAFFPQFIGAGAYVQSYVMLGAIFLTLEAIAIAIYALIGAFAARRAASKIHWFHRVSGIGMMVFGGLLLLLKRPT